MLYENHVQIARNSTVHLTACSGLHKMKPPRCEGNLKMSFSKWRPFLHACLKTMCVTKALKTWLNSSFDIRCSWSRPRGNRVGLDFRTRGSQSSDHRARNPSSFQYCCDILWFMRWYLTHWLRALVSFNNNTLPETMSSHISMTSLGHNQSI